MSNVRSVTLGRTGIVTPQNGFGALPVQRVSTETAVRLLRKAYDGGMTFFDTARAYSDSEEKVGIAFEDVRKNLFLATKTHAKTPDEVKRQLEQSLRLLRTDYLDVYQFHCADRCYCPGDGTGMYELMQSLKAQGIVRHIGITAHKIGVAEEIVRSGLYETLQYPLSYLSTDREIRLARDCAAAGMGFIAMKGLAGGLLTNSDACFAFMSRFESLVPIWGVQREEELDAWLRYMSAPVSMTPELAAFIESDRSSLNGSFCRGCGYCMPCTAGITINQCARMSLMLRRAPSQSWLSPEWQEQMRRIESCVDCGVCKTRCPYELDIPALLRRNYEDYQNVLSGKTTV